MFSLGSTRRRIKPDRNNSNIQERNTSSFTNRRQDSSKLGHTLPDISQYCLQQSKANLNPQVNPQSKMQQLLQNKSKIAKLFRQRLDNDNSFSQNYSIGDSLRRRTQAPLAAYVFSGYTIQDYNEQINGLHKQLLKKVILNR